MEYTHKNKSMYKYTEYLLHMELKKIEKIFGTENLKLLVIISDFQII